jgi:transcriptional regulator with XRE-family HTH domain
MAKSFIDEWAGATQADRQIMAEEEFILDITEGIWEALEGKGWNKVQLAEALGVSRSHVTQLLNGNRNMTLRTLADIAFALGLKPRIELLEEHETNTWIQIGRIPVSRAKASNSFAVGAEDEGWTPPIPIAA